LADTDGDGLTDGQEYVTYLTNPLIIDTDGDSFPDGAEVSNGYNPNGTGKLPAQFPPLDPTQAKAILESVAAGNNGAITNTATNTTTNATTNTATNTTSTTESTPTNNSNQ
jgi:hypothetical protein